MIPEKGQGWLLSRVCEHLVRESHWHPWALPGSSMVSLGIRSSQQASFLSGRQHDVNFNQGTDCRCRYVGVCVTPQHPPGPCPATEQPCHVGCWWHVLGVQGWGPLGINECFSKRSVQLPSAHLITINFLQHPPISVGRTYDSWPWDQEFEPHVGCRDPLNKWN